MPKLINFRFAGGWYFLLVRILNWKDPLKYFFLFPDGIAGRYWVKRCIVGQVTSVFWRGHTLPIVLTNSVWLEGSSELISLSVTFRCCLQKTKWKMLITSIFAVRFATRAKWPSGRTTSASGQRRSRTRPRSSSRPCTWRSCYTPAIGVRMRDWTRVIRTRLWNPSRIPPKLS